MPTTEPPGAAPAAVARPRVNIRGVLAFAILAGRRCSSPSAAAMFVLFRTLERKERAEDRTLPPMIAASLARTPPEPRLEDRTRSRRARSCTREEDELLTTYGWVDKERGHRARSHRPGHGPHRRARTASRQADARRGPPRRRPSRRGNPDEAIHPPLLSILRSAATAGSALPIGEAADPRCARMTVGQSARDNGGCLLLMTDLALGGRTRPPMLRDVGIDQRLGAAAAARRALRRRARPARAPRPVLRPRGPSSSCSPITTARCSARRSSTASSRRCACS